jgi:hypothetical protein
MDARRRLDGHGSLRSQHPKEDVDHGGDPASGRSAAAHGSTPYEPWACADIETDPSRPT